MDHGDKVKYFDTIVRIYSRLSVVMIMLQVKAYMALGKREIRYTKAYLALYLPIFKLSQGQ